ncbi:ADP-ribosylation factor-like [Ornithorhynchus anatinus]|uniref:ADP-ribosylation factor-like n=1 Tax=Ornithorhynchus anatinus TaxID=9258 RepID=UPI000223F3B5|nr:ADP-ribosylation factor-like [Ornithorhynchus anatinus]
MGILLTRLWNALAGFSGLQARVLLLGLDAAGKSTILHRWKFNEAVHTIPTVGFSVETLELPGHVTFTVWDVGGQKRIRALWRHYYANTEGLVFVVDSTDLERFGEAAAELEAILDHEEMCGVPCLVLANKQDLPGAHRPAQVAEALGLRKRQGHSWHVQGCCAVSGEGLVEGLKRLSTMVKQHRAGWVK